MSPNLWDTVRQACWPLARASEPEPQELSLCHARGQGTSWRGEYSPGLANSLGLGFSTEAGALIMQPKMLKGIKVWAEAMGSP
jgi:hypothetical protein